MLEEIFRRQNMIRKVRLFELMSSSLITKVQRVLASIELALMLWQKDCCVGERLLLSWLYTTKKMPMSASYNQQKPSFHRAQRQLPATIKFIYSEKATNIWPIFHL